MNQTKGKTGVIYDDRMMDHYCLWAPHPECPERYCEIIKRCSELGLLERCHRLPARLASTEEVITNHEIDMYTTFKSTKNINDAEYLEKLSSKFNSIYFHPLTFKLAHLSAGCVLELIEQIANGQIQNGMAIVRPPGHHAGRSEINGFCYFNNVAMAAQLAINRKYVNKILIVDWDVHHGQGTQQFFYDSSNVLYFSIHRYEHGLYWPHLQESDYDAIGTGSGKGYNFNVPINKIGARNEDYLAIWQQILIPVAMEFQPNLIIISAGYDSAYGCPLGEMSLTPACYAHLLSPLMALANGKVGVVLEGGYNIDSLAEGVAVTLKTLLGDPCPAFIDSLESPCQNIQESIMNCIHSHRAYWKCFEIYDTYSQNDLNNCNDRELHIVKKMFKGSVTDNVNDRYATRYIFPEITDEKRQIISSRLDQLKMATNLEFSTLRVCNASFENNFNQNEINCWLKSMNLWHRLYKITYNKPDDRYLAIEGPDYMKLLFQTIDFVIDGQSQCGICINLGEKTPNNEWLNSGNIAAKYAVQSKIRILLLEWCEHSDKEMEHQSLYDSSSVLRVLIYRPKNDGNDSIDDEKDNFHLNNKFNIKIPLNTPNAITMDYTAVFQRVLLPIAYEFNPQLTIASIDFTTVAHKNSIAIFGHLIHWLQSLANGRIILNLRGNLTDDTDSSLMLNCIKALFHDPLPFDYQNSLDHMKCLRIIRNILKSQQNYWKSLVFNKKLPESVVV